MRSCSKTYTITEYGRFSRGVAAFGYQALPEGTFDALEAFLLANTADTDTETEPIELLSLSARRSPGKIITARNYVGLITMTDGTVIEILPKIAGGDVTPGEVRRVFLKMLRALDDATFKASTVSHLDTARLNLFEIFVKMFLTEVAVLVKQGLAASYMSIEENARFCRGKLLVSQNVKHNPVNKERFFVSYDDFSLDRPENRLLKATLRFLLVSSSDVRNRQQAAQLIAFFDTVQCSTDYDTDFAKCHRDRRMNHYARALSWCQVLLRGNSFTVFTGTRVALALLFPMETVFEKFVTKSLRKHLGSDTSLRTQDSRYSLFESPSPTFALRPDMVLESGGRTVVLDTKWKLLSDNARNYGISQADMYQMYAYSKKYEADGVTLVYPRTDATSTHDIAYASDDNVQVDVFFIDLRNADESISQLLSEVTSFA